MTSSGTYNFQLSNADIALEAFSRCEIRPPAITGSHMIEARRSLNLELQTWSNTVPMLWKMDLLTVNLIQGVSTYSLPPNTACILDTYVRLYTLQNTFNVAPAASITTGSPLVSFTVPNHGLQTGNFVNFVTPVSIGNLIVQGFYQVTSVLSASVFTITAAVNATSTVTNAGALPSFATIAGQPTIQVTLPNHGLLPGQIFNVAAFTQVGGIFILGAYTVSSVTSGSVFTITSAASALQTASGYENNGYMQVQTQSATTNPVDYIMTPLGRTDYADIPDKMVQGRPTSYWYDRLINPNITLWQVPDANGPYQLCMWRMLQVQDANVAQGETPDVPYRFYDALCGKLSVRLGMKYAKDMLPALKAESDVSWEMALGEDRERADIYILPDFPATIGINMAWRPHGRAKVNAKSPRAWGVCDRCGMLYNLEQLVWQYDWRGAKVTNIKLRVCTLTCLDKPYEGRRPLKLPPDPMPVKDPRPTRYAIDEQNTYSPGNPPPAPPPTWDEPGLLWDNGETLWD